MSAPSTPKQEEMDSVSSTADVKIAVASVEAINPGIPMQAKLAHVLAAFVSATIALCVAAVLADGKSVIKLKDVDALPIITDEDATGLHYRADELLGPTYGVGLHHDQSGRSWNEAGAGSTLSYLVENLGLPAVVAAVPHVISIDSLKHPVHFLSCDELEKAGMSAMSLGFIAELASILMVLFHALCIAGLVPSKIGKVLAALVWFVLTAGFGIVVMLAIGIYTTEWECKNVVVPRLRLSDHFDYTYGYVFAIIGYVASLLIFCVTLCFTSTTDGATDKAKNPFSLGGAAAKTLCGVATGLVASAVIANVVLASNGGFNPDDDNTDYTVVNPCYHQKPYHAGPNDHYFSNTECFQDTVAQTLEQAGANVTRGYVGGMDAGDRVPILEMYENTDLCPVNVHWHLGAEHLSVGEYDEHGTGPDDHHNDTSEAHRALASADAEIRAGGRCHHYDVSDAKFTTPYDWQYCTGMLTGETYEVHWPHSAAGACGTQWQYQTPFYDGVFCNDGIITITPLNTYEKIGVQGQVYTIVNDGLGTASPFHYDNMIAGMIMEGEFGQDIAKYTGSTTGTSRDNEMCSRYTPITWQVDRKCHMISASSFDKMCQDMLAMSDDMSGDVYPHGAREVVSHELTANNQANRKK